MSGRISIPQLRQVVKELGIPVNSEPAEYREIHVALLTGLLSHIGMKDADKQEYTGARNARFSIFPGSGLFQKTAEMDNGRRTGGDQPPVGAHRCPH
ncbi:ATP-dependent RNA helicase HrpA [Salmonella enterica subsp. enterica]|uniref:ATP-dependent RNA helicase HrpA n=1 Tax=Salmonella enterica I TaxID=59201 RepID=A0A447U2S4_SALET|nr:ATP-dependent RNA helicase HrpA [Salmonella enterica subsp. enterica]